MPQWLRHAAAPEDMGSVPVMVATFLKKGEMGKCVCVEILAWIKDRQEVRTNPEPSVVENQQTKGRDVQREPRVLLA